jgi:hypothetical protein
MNLPLELAAWTLPSEDLGDLPGRRVIATMVTSPSLETSDASFADGHWYRTLAVCVDHDRVKDQTSS